MFERSITLERRKRALYAWKFPAKVITKKECYGLAENLSNVKFVGFADSKTEWLKKFLSIKILQVPEDHSLISKNLEVVKRYS
jgi:hypothetical protein